MPWEWYVLKKSFNNDQIHDKYCFSAMCISMPDFAMDKDWHIMQNIMISIWDLSYGCWRANLLHVTLQSHEAMAELIEWEAPRKTSNKRCEFQAPSPFWIVLGRQVVSRKIESIDGQHAVAAWFSGITLQCYWSGIQKETPFPTS